MSESSKTKAVRSKSSMSPRKLVATTPSSRNNSNKQSATKNKAKTTPTSKKTKHTLNTTRTPQKNAKSTLATPKSSPKKAKTPLSSKSKAKSSSTPSQSTISRKSSSSSLSSSKKSKTPNGKQKETLDSAESIPQDSLFSLQTPKAAATKPITPKSSTGKRSYLQFIQEAIVTLKDRSGSSQVAIAKYLLTQYPTVLKDGKPFRTRLSMALKAGVQNGVLTKLKNSFKMNAAHLKKERQKQQQKKQSTVKQRDAMQEQLEQKRKEEQKKELEANMTEEEKQVLADKRAKEQEERLKKEETARWAKERAERIRKRKFPMDDVKLVQEDKELGVKPPEDVQKRPLLPYFFHATLPLDHSKRKGATPASIRAPSKCDMLHGNRGLVSDVMQIYHFFRGDVQISSLQKGARIPEFSIRHLMHAVEEILNGNAKKSRMIPPLLTHLFVTCLGWLTSSSSLDSSTAQSDESRCELRLKRDLSKLAAGMSPASWAEVCFLYMDTMERYFTTSASLDPNVWQSEAIDIPYLMRATDVPMTLSDDGDTTTLPEGYGAYLGDSRSSLARAHAKLARMDPWNLTAEELMALLRALTDDILAMNPEIGEDISRRDGAMSELLKAKKAADYQYRKVRLAFEGPRKQTKTKSEEKAEGTEGESKEDETTNDPTPRRQLVTSDEDSESGDHGAQDPNGAATGSKVSKFKPTATKKQFEIAKKLQQKAHDAYEKGLRTLVARTEPIGHDRNHNAVYFFKHDPDMLYVEVVKPPAVPLDHIPADMQMNRMSWHVIETKSLFDDFVASLDIRGTREHELYEALLGPEGGSHSLRRSLYDDIKQHNAIIARKKEREELERRLVNARIACDAEEQSERRSGRLQSRAQLDLAQVEMDIEELDKRVTVDSTPYVPDYDELTGLTLMRKFDSIGRSTRKSRELKALAIAQDHEELPCTTLLPCTKLVPTGNIDGTGVVGWIVADLLELESRCESLCPWERDEVTRTRWITDMEELVSLWNNTCQMLVGSTVTCDSDEGSEAGSESASAPSEKGKRNSSGSLEMLTDAKRRKLIDESSASSLSLASPSQLLSLLKLPLLDLEKRVLEITGLAMATRDADEADDNMSTTSNDEEEQQRSAQEKKENMTWKKKINMLRTIETKRQSQIREVVVAAIAAARKAQLSSVVAKLRSALLLHHGNAAGECKAAALAVLNSHGGYQVEDNDSDDELEVEGENNDDEQEIPSLLCGEAMMINGSLSGDEDANRVDWIDAVKSSKTVSRWAAAAVAFIRNANKRLDKIESEQETLYRSVHTWEKEERSRVRNSKPKATNSGPTEVWTNVHFTNDFCMAKLEGYPWWPAKKCEAKDAKLAASLASLGRVLVSLIGEDGGLRVVPLEDIRKFDGEIDSQDLSTQTKAVRTQLEECMAMTRRIIRGRQLAGEDNFFLEEKKMST